MAGGSHYLTLFSLVRIVLLLRADADDSAKFYLAANGVTVHCPGAAVGDSGEVNGFMYTKRNRDQLTEVNAPTACTSGITDMSQLFSNTNFNGDISTWDTSQVTQMDYMFQSASSFNQAIGSWNTSQVTTMNSMFQNARSFDQNLSLWCVERLKTAPPMFDSGANFEGDSAKQPQWGMPCSRFEGWSRTREVSQVPYVDETDVFTLAPTIDKEFQVFGASKSLKLRMFSPDRYPYRYYGYAKHKEWNGAWPNYVNPFSEFGVCGIRNCCKSNDKNECDQCTKGSPSSGYPCYSCGSLSETCTQARENTLIGSELSGPVMVVNSFAELREGFKRTGWKDFYCDISAGSSSVASTQFPFRVFKGDGNLVTDSLCRPMEPLLDYAMADKFTFVNAGCLASYPKCTRRGVFLKSVDAVSEDPRILDWLDSHSIYPLIQPHKQVLRGYTYLSNNGDLPWVSVSVSDNVPDSAMQLSLTSHGEQELIEGCNAIPMQLQWHKQGMAQSLRYGAVDSNAQVTIAQVDGVSRNNLPSGEVNATSKYPELCQTRTHGEAPTKLSQSPKPRKYNDSKGSVAASVGHLAEQIPVMEENIETTKERTTIPGHFSGRGMHTDKGSPPDTSWVNGCSFRTVESPSQVPISALLLSELAFSCTGASALSGFVLQSIAGGTDRFYYEYRCVALETRNPFDRPAEKQSNKTITITRNFDEEIAQNRPQDWYLTYPNKFVSSILDFTSDDFILLQLGKVTCGEYFIKGFHLDLDSRILVDENTIEDKVKYTWECSGTRVREDTCTVQQTMGGMAMNLQEFAQSYRTIDCKDQYLSAFELVRSESGDYYYEYRCCGAYEDLISAFLGTLQSLNRTEIETYQIDHDPDTLSMEWSLLQLNATALQSQIAEAPFAFPQAHELVTEIGFSQRLFRAWWPFLLAQHHRPTEDNLLAVPKYNILKYMKGSDIQDYLKSIQQTIDGLEQQWDSTKDKSFEFNVLLISLDNVGSLITNMEEAQVKYMKNQVDLQLAALKLQNSAACGRLKTSQDVTDARAEGIAKRQETFEEEIRKWQRQQKLKTVLNMVKGLGNGFRAASKFFGAALGKGDGALEKFLDGFGLFWNFGFDLGMSAQSVHQAQVSTGKLVDAAKAAKDLYEHYAALYTSLPEALRVPACADIQRNVTSNSTQEIVDSVAYMTSVARALGGFSSLMLEDIEISIEQYYSQFTSGSMVDTAVSTAALNLQKEIIAAVRASFDTKESLVVFLAESIQLSAAMNLQNYTDESNNVVQEYQSKKDSLKDDVRARTEFMMVNMWHSTTGTLLNIISN